MERDPMEGNVENSTAGLLAKRKRGRPRKSDTVLLPAEITNLGVISSSDGKLKRCPHPEADGSHVCQGSRSLIGQTVNGVIDGSFDAGYLVTVRIENDDSIYRGVIFGPGLSVPPSKITDIAPKVKFTQRDQSVSLVPSENVYEQTSVIEHTPTVSGIIPENTFKNQHHESLIEEAGAIKSEKRGLAE
eukprot:TRINITY_DN37814_c0_g1_i1.p1 TRINITY_DN37814_c0_g1~~TRINITY_DN37814_c0_g1_i1.p1  ORF type:complete len:188 (-),score=46.60 TRINITY_DN37814_c0_g1_i1:250-813(-)